MAGSIESPGSRERHRASLAEINVTPLVDVVLVLLIIFMVTAPMMQKAVDVDLPRAESAAGAEEQRLIVTIDRTNRVFLNQTSMPLADLEKHLTAVASSYKDPFVYLRADQAVPYGRVMSVMDRIKKAGIGKVGLVTEPGPSTESAGGRSRAGRAP
ncbi:MAG TPA: biopolymer transporter ExbD [Candidatus Polarisedimenticolia bacterium]|nr:biopolymer transporter ExbD [Candidatus Polarisedimenticolia bacterium]